MGRPVEVHDEEVIAAGLRLEGRGIEIKPTRLWTELGERGRPKRMIAVWAEHVAGRVPAVDATAAATPLVPERVRRLADGLKSQLATELERLAKTIYDEVQATVTSRFQDEFAAMAVARAANRSEIDEALDAIDRLGEQRDSLQATLRQTEEETAATRRECNVKDDWLNKAALERVELEDRLAALRETVESERSENADLRIALMRAETRVESCAASLELLGQTLRATGNTEETRRNAHTGLHPAKPPRAFSKLARRGAQGANNIAIPPASNQDIAHESRPERPS